MDVGSVIIRMIAASQARRRAVSPVTKEPESNRAVPPEAEASASMSTVTTTVGRPWRRVGMSAWSKKWRHTATSPLARRCSQGRSRSPSCSAAVSTAICTHSSPSLVSLASIRPPAGIGVTVTDSTTATSFGRCSRYQRSTSRATASAVIVLAASTSRCWSSAEAVATRPSSMAFAFDRVPSARPPATAGITATAAASSTSRRAVPRRSPAFQANHDVMSRAPSTVYA